MRNLLIASLSSLFLATAALSGCAPGSENDDEGSSTAAPIKGGPRVVSLVGDYHPIDENYPLLSLDANGTYLYDTGIRCIQAPCPSGDAGTWYLGDDGIIHLTATTPDPLDPQRSVEIVWGDPPTLLVEDRSGERHELTPVAEAEPPTSCAAVRCISGTLCQIVGGVAQCVP